MDNLARRLILAHLEDDPDFYASMVRADSGASDEHFAAANQSAMVAAGYWRAIGQVELARKMLLNDLAREPWT